MRWALPAAGLLALGILAPLAAHLLSRRPPRPLPFPTLRFLQATPTSARRLRTLHDRGLWALRTLVVLVIAGAAAGPTWNGETRRARWQPPPVRAVVVPPDTPDAGQRAGDQGATTYASGSVRAGVAAALADLARQQDVPRELVIRWDGRRRAFDAFDLAAIPDDVGVTLEVVTTSSGAADHPTEMPIDAADADTAARDRVRESVAAHVGRPMRVSWPGGPMRERWEQDAAPPSSELEGRYRALRLDPRLADAARRSTVDPRVAAPSGRERLDRRRFVPLARDASGVVLAWGAMLEDDALLVLDARVADPLSLWLLRSAAEVWHQADGTAADARWRDDEVAAAQRAPAPTAVSDLPGGLDTRLWWAAALMLVLLEGVLRRRRDAAERAPEVGEVPDAA